MAAMSSALYGQEDDMERALALSMAMANLEPRAPAERVSNASEADFNAALQASLQDADDVATQRAIELAMEESLREGAPPLIDCFSSPPAPAEAHRARPVRAEECTVSGRAGRRAGEEAG